MDRLAPASRRPTRLGPYEVIGKVASGGLAVIYLGRGLEPDAPALALKVARTDLRQNLRVARMFNEEARLLPLLRHENIVRTVDVGVDAGRGYIAMELLSGVTLHAVHKSCASHGIGLQAEMVARIGARIADALAYAHGLCDESGKSLSIVHRDVNPTNVMLTFEGDIKLFDFGLAKTTQQETETSVGILKGKIPYVSPEQIMQLPLDGRSDLFGLGTTLWELAAGRRLFRRDNDAETLLAVKAARIPDPREVAPDLDEAIVPIIMRALERDRDARYPNAAAMRDDLRQFLRARGVAEDDRSVAGLVGCLFSAERQRQRNWLKPKLVSPSILPPPPSRSTPRRPQPSSAEI